MSAKTTTSSKHQVVSRDEWLTARKKLLLAEKELTHRSDELAKQRQDLPWVRVDKDYQFDTAAGKVSLKDLFQGRSQLIIYHFMFGPDFSVGCPSCSSIADSFNGVFTHLANHDVTMGAISRAPLVQLQTYQKRMGWSFPWASSIGSDFNYDFNVSVSEAQERAGSMEYNYQRNAHAMDLTPPPEPIVKIAESCGTDAAGYCRERPGMSAFVLDGGAVYHTYSAFARGLDVLWNVYQWLDRTPFGRNESDFWIRRHDEYGAPMAKVASCCQTRAKS